MNLRGAQAERFLRAPPADMAGALIHGADADRVGDARRDLVRAFAGADAEAEMRLTRIMAADLRGDPAAPLDALKAVGFFPGPRVVSVEGVAEPQAAPVLAALAGWAPGDAALVVTAPALKKASKLRAGFEGHAKAAAFALYDDPLGRAEVEAMVAAEGLDLTADARAALEALAVALEPGELRQFIGKLALYADGAVADAEAVAAVAPATLDAEAEAAIHAAADGRAAAVAPLLRRLSGSAANPVSLAILATRHFGQLHAAALGTGQPWGRHRDAMARQARAWGPRRLEGALALLMETDLVLRSATAAPQMAVIERALIRLARMAGARD